MSLRLCVVFISAWFSCQSLWAADAWVVEIRDTERGQGLCSATLIKYISSSSPHGTCTLVTNAHCVSSSDHFIVSDLDARKYSSMVQPILGSLQLNRQVGDRPSRLLSRRNLLDLAELEVPPEFKRRYCDSGQLRAVKGMSFHEFTFLNASVAAVGVIDQSPVIRYTDNSPWPALQMRPFTFTETQVKELPLLITTNGLSIVSGMSGGPVFVGSGQWAGLTTEMGHGHVDRLFFIASDDVIQFLQSRRELDAPGVEFLSPNRNQPVGRGSRQNGGRNTQQGNVLATLEDLFFPEDGVQEGSMTIIGLCKNGIDGRDDLAQARAQHCSEAPVIRGVNGFPDFETRQSILSRLQGGYATLDAQAMLYATSPQGWRRLPLRASLSLSLKIDRNGRIQIRIPPINWSGSTASNLRGLQTSASQLDLAAQIKEEGRVVLLQGASLPLVCKNSQYSGLNCSNADMLLSVKRHKLSGTLDFNFAFVTDVKAAQGHMQRTLIQYTGILAERAQLEFF